MIELSVSQQLMLERIKRDSAQMSKEELQQYVVDWVKYAMGKENLAKKLIEKDCRDRFDG